MEQLFLLFCTFIIGRRKPISNVVDIGFSLALQCYYYTYIIDVVVLDVMPCSPVVRPDVLVKLFTNN